MDPIRNFSQQIYGGMCRLDFVTVIRRLRIIANDELLKVRRYSFSHTCRLSLRALILSWRVSSGLRWWFAHTFWFDRFGDFFNR
jgi:hypothetical protein